MAQVIENKPVLGKSWQTASLDTGDIHDQINALWAELERSQPKVTTSPDGVTDPLLSSGLMRANTLNLLAVAPTARDARLIQETVAKLHDFLPSRTIIILMQDARNGGESSELYDVHVELLEQKTHGERSGGPKLRFETITIGAPVQDIGRLPSLVEPLFVPELEDFLWWPAGDHTSSQLFLDLVEIVDRVIIDSARSGRDETTAVNLRRIYESDEKFPPVGDFTWQRLAPWRSLIAQFFDPSDTQACLHAIEQVTIKYASDRGDGSTGAPAAILTVGWLGSRLGWEIIDPLERRKDGSYWAPLRAKSGDRNRQIVVRIEPDNSPHARFSLRSVEIVAVGDAPGTFKVERTDSDDLVTSSETPNNPLVSRMVYSKRPEVGTMLADELRRFGRDPIFDDAAQFSVRLVDMGRAFR
jgi:glucose-6-phosphate dehydrogenase assembly protein OpcA